MCSSDLKLRALEACARPARPLPRGRHGHIQERVLHLRVDEEPPLAEVIHLLRHLGDGILAAPRDADVALAPGIGDAEGDASGQLVPSGESECVGNHT